MERIFPESTLRLPGRHLGPLARHKLETLDDSWLRFVRLLQDILGVSWESIKTGFSRTQCGIREKDEIFVEGNADSSEKKLLRTSHL